MRQLRLRCCKLYESLAINLIRKILARDESLQTMSYNYTFDKSQIMHSGAEEHVYFEFYRSVFEKYKL